MSENTSNERASREDQTEHKQGGLNDTCENYFHIKVPLAKETSPKIADSVK